MSWEKNRTTTLWNNNPDTNRLFYRTVARKFPDTINVSEYCIISPTFPWMFKMFL